MAVQKIFWIDPYLAKLDAIVLTVNQANITLDKTIFYAFSGGQESDSGTIGGFEVLDARKSGDEIIYTIDAKHDLRAMQEVIVEIDWKKRYRLMKLHSAAEIILELVYQNYDHPNKLGANISYEKARIDFSWEGNISSIFPELTRKAMEIINSDLKIENLFSDENNDRRYWQIEGFAKTECCGTHIKRTGEIGEITLKRKSMGSGKERIEIYLLN